MSAPEEKSPAAAAAAAAGKEKKKSKESKKSSDAKTEDSDAKKSLDVKADEVVEKASDAEVRLIDETGGGLAEKPSDEKVESTKSDETAEAKKPDEKPEPKKSKAKKSVPSDNPEDSIPFAELVQQNFMKELMIKAEKKSNELKLNMMAQLNEVFRLFDIDRDGVIGEMDLKYTFSSLGDTNVSEDKIKSMLSECPQPIDFNAFVDLFESKEMEFDSEFDLIKAFAKWDSQNNGMILEEKIKNDLMRKGDRFSEKDADRALEEAPLYDEGGNPSIDYIEFCTNLCGFQNIRNSDLFQDKYSRSSSRK